ncbi:MAG TPA: cysteine--tRNA ligase [Candidatus Acidoferrales bacterium]|nr:cysteine--tRNA ligase [Candidatus Acidoferrales bacterium]
MGLRIYNTLSGTKEDFLPLSPGQVRMYVCGVTVYDDCHVGHARSLVTFDVIVRYLRFLGYEVTFVRNFTDVDDKIIQRAKEQGISARQLAEKYIEAFYRDAAALGLVTPTYEPKATEHIADMIALIRRLEERGAAYRVDGDVYFDVSRFPEYGKLSRKRLEELAAGARVEIDERKRHPADFALWKESKEGEPFWESPWGKGRPGWHIECSAMSSKYLGQPFDIHGGGLDLIFPHHENEIAQSEAAHGAPFARYWLHHGLVTIDQEKMSKSLGNIATIQEVLSRADAATLRHYFLASHYRSPLDFSDQGLEEAGKALERLYETFERMERVAPVSEQTEPSAEVLEAFREAMNDDFNTPKALALMFDEARALNRMADEGKTAELRPRWAAVKKAGEALGLLQQTPQQFFAAKKERWLKRHQIAADWIDDMLGRREKARREKNWQEADRIRAELKRKGIILEDSPEGTTWKVR